MFNESIDVSDFRAEAIQASQRFCRAGTDADLLTIGRSLCIPVPGATKNDLFRPGLISLTALIIGFAGLIGGALLATGAQDGSGTATGPDTARLTIAALCSIGGIATFFVGIFLASRWVWKTLDTRIDTLMHRPWTIPPRRVNLEDARTFQKIKLRPEDMGIAFFDTERRRILIEGIRCRYVVLADDIEDFETVKAPGSVGSILAVNIDGAVLRIVLQQDSNLRFELRRQTIGGGTHPLHRDLEETLLVTPELL